MYSIERNIREGIPIVRLVNLNTSESVSVVPEHGARIFELLLLNHSQLQTIVAPTANPEDGAILFPFPDRVRNNHYYHETEHTIPEESATSYGLLLDKIFTVEKELASEAQAVLQLKYASTGEPGYPFPFCLTISFELSNNGFRCKTTIHNTGGTTIPAAAGWNPCIQLSPNLDDWNLSFNPKSELILDQKLVLAGTKIPDKQKEEYQPLKSFPVSSCFSLTSNSHHTIKLYNAAQHTSIQLWMQGGTRGMNYLKIMIEENNNRIALIPMTAAPDAFHNALGLFLMETCDLYEFSWGIKVGGEY